MKASLYLLATGEFTGVIIGGDREHIDSNTPAGYAWIRGEFDHETSRVDIDTGEVVEVAPPEPSAAHLAEAADIEARTAILLHEDLSARTMREALLELLPASSASRRRLQSIEDAVVAARRGLKK